MHIYTHIWLPIYDSLIYIHICIIVQIYEYSLLNPFLLFNGMWNSISLWDSLSGSIAAWYHISPSDSSRGISLQHLRAFYLFLILPSTILVCFMMPQPIKMTRCQDKSPVISILHSSFHCSRTYTNTSSHILLSEMSDPQVPGNCGFRFGLGKQWMWLRSCVLQSFLNGARTRLYVWREHGPAKDARHWQDTPGRKMCISWGFLFCLKVPFLSACDF